MYQIKCGNSKKKKNQERRHFESPISTVIIQGIYSVYIKVFWLFHQIRTMQFC